MSKPATKMYPRSFAMGENKGGGTIKNDLVGRDYFGEPGGGGKRFLCFRESPRMAHCGKRAGMREKITTVTSSMQRGEED